MQHYTIFFIIVKHYMFQAVSPPIITSSKTVHTASGICHACMLPPLAWVSWNSPTASMGELELTHTSGSSMQAWHIPDAVCTVFELVMMGGETAWNMQSLKIIKNIV